LSWKNINFILGLAVTDPAFFHLLREHPQEAAAAHGLELTPRELAVLQQISADTLDEFSRQLIDKLGPDTKNP
jgi:hypothetical protein